MGVEFAENENGLLPPSLMVLLLLLLLLPEPNWKGVAAGWLLFTLAPNSNIFLVWGSSEDDVAVPNGLPLAIPPNPTEGVDAPKAGADDWPKMDVAADCCC